MSRIPEDIKSDSALLSSHLVFQVGIIEIYTKGIPKIPEAWEFVAFRFPLDGEHFLLIDQKHNEGEPPRVGHSCPEQDGPRIVVRKSSDADMVAYWQRRFDKAQAAEGAARAECARLEALLAEKGSQAPVPPAKPAKLRQWLFVEVPAYARGAANVHQVTVGPIEDGIRAEVASGVVIRELKPITREQINTATGKTTGAYCGGSYNRLWVVSMLRELGIEVED